MKLMITKLNWIMIKKREIKALHKQMEKLERNYASTFSEITKESESMIDDKHKEIRNLQMALNNHRANTLVPLTVIGINMNEILKLRVKPMMTIAELASCIRDHRKLGSQTAIALMYRSPKGDRFEFFYDQKKTLRDYLGIQKSYSI
eukprot:683513_1